MPTPPTDADTPRFLGLGDACPITPGATVSKPLLNLPEGKVVIFAMDQGQEMSEHAAPFAAAVHVLDGRLRFTIDGQTREMGPHDWLVMPANARHSLKANEPTRFLLTLFKRG
ncbi:MAG: cupin domain-containing protein [Phycisphaerales bacterium]|nr:cupin domain-containing protein [Phycisphaerales bacterium]